MPLDAVKVQNSIFSYLTGLPPQDTAFQVCFDMPVANTTTKHLLTSTSSYSVMNNLRCAYFNFLLHCLIKIHCCYRQMDRQKHVMLVAYSRISEAFVLLQHTGAELTAVFIMFVNELLFVYF